MVRVEANDLMSAINVERDRHLRALQHISDEAVFAILGEDQVGLTSEEALFRAAMYGADLEELTSVKGGVIAQASHAGEIFVVDRSTVGRTRNQVGRLATFADDPAVWGFLIQTEADPSVFDSNSSEYDPEASSNQRYVGSFVVAANTVSANYFFSESDCYEVDDATYIPLWTGVRPGFDGFPFLPNSAGFVSGLSNVMRSEFVHNAVVADLVTSFVEPVETDQ